VNARQIGLLAALSAIWGGSYLLIKYALDGYSAAAIVSFRCLLASGVLLVALKATGVGLPRNVKPKWALILGITAVAIPFMLITFGEHVVPTGLTAVLISPSSLFVALFAPLIDASEKIDRRQGLGMGIGLLGVALVVGVESVSTLDEFLGALAMIGAAAFYGLSTFIVKGRFGAYAAMQTSWLSVSIAGVATLPVALATTPGHSPTLGASAALLVLGVVGTALAFVIFYKLINEVGAGRASLVSYLAPGVALFYGASFRGETITAAAVGGLVLILGGVFIASRRGARAVASRDSGPDAVTGRGGVPRRRSHVDLGEPSGARAEL
jgi:drug/metabolite transporter (DMT)-like permease